MSELKVTPMEEIRRAAGEQIVALPGFGDGRPFVARLRRVSLLQMAEEGVVPNELLTSVSRLYHKGAADAGDIRLTAKTLRLIAGRALAEPTLDELNEAGVTLSDTQLTAIYLFTRSGLEGLRPFRREPAFPGPVPGGAGVEDAAKRIAGA